MGRNTATINYGIASVFRNTFPMYVFGSGILTFWNFLATLLTDWSIEGATQAALDYYVQKLTPFPVDEFLTAGGIEEVLANIMFAIIVGAAVAAYRYRKNRYPSGHR